jgi:ribosome-associated protein
MDSEGLARLAAEAADDRKAVDIRLLRVEDVTTLTDWFVVCSGLSDVQVRAIARSVEDRLRLIVIGFPCAGRALPKGVGCCLITAI